jgi:hypothetical protein
MPQAARHGDRRHGLLTREATRRLVAAVLTAMLAMLATMLATILAPAQARPAASRACDLYRELDRRCGCTGTNYFRDYGEKYCERFVRSNGWSGAGLRWRARTLSCLQDDLRQFLAHQFLVHQGRSCSCAAVKAFAFSSHARCYTQLPASVCRLPLSDIGRITTLVDGADLIDPLGSRQTLAITLACMWQNGNAGARPDGIAR